MISPCIKTSTAKGRSSGSASESKFWQPLISPPSLLRRRPLCPATTTLPYQQMHITRNCGII
jgi:hypothetical protein